MMDAESIMTIISTVGFPIFCVLALGLYIYKRDIADREDREKVNNIIQNFSLNMQENTHALQNLTDIIKDQNKGDN